MYAAIRQGKAKTGTAEELARRIKEGAIPIISDVEGFMAYYVVYAPDDTVTAISIFNNHAGAEESNRRAFLLELQLGRVPQRAVALVQGADQQARRVGGGRGRGGRGDGEHGARVGEGPAERALDSRPSGGVRPCRGRPIRTSRGTWSMAAAGWVAPVFLSARRWSWK